MNINLKSNDNTRIYQYSVYLKLYWLKVLTVAGIGVALCMFYLDAMISRLMSANSRPLYQGNHHNKTTLTCYWTCGEMYAFVPLIPIGLISKTVQQRPLE